MLSTTNACKITDGIYIACNRKYSEILFGVLIFGEGDACLKAIFIIMSQNYTTTRVLEVYA